MKLSIQGREIEYDGLECGINRNGYYDSYTPIHMSSFIERINGMSFVDAVNAVTTIRDRALDQCTSQESLEGFIGEDNERAQNIRRTYALMDDIIRSLSTPRAHIRSTNNSPSNSKPQDRAG